jgi:hypothetical protein
MRTEIWDIGPTEAAELLGGMVHNRPIVKGTVERYARAMTDGRWLLTGQAISVHQNGDGKVHMLNGAHRMNAVIKSGTVQKFLIVFEDDEHVFVTFDTGRNRSTSVLMGMLDQPQSSAAAAISRCLIMYERAPDILWNKSDIVAGDEVLAWYENLTEHGHDMLTEATRLVGELRKGFKHSGAWYGALMYLIRTDSKQPELLASFHEAVRTGASLPAGDPRLAYRNFIIGQSTSHSSATDVSRQIMLTIGIRAWNDWLNDEERSFYKFKPGYYLNGKRVQSSLPMPKVR